MNRLFFCSFAMNTNRNAAEARGRGNIKGEFIRGLLSVQTECILFLTFEEWIPRFILLHDIAVLVTDR